MKNIQNHWISFFLAILLIFVTGCSQESDNSTSKEIDKKELATKINSLSDSLSVPMEATLAKKLSLDLMRSCLEFVDAFPADNRCADYLFTAARAAGGLGQHEKSLSLLNRIKKGYNGYSKMPEVYFLYAFILDEDLEDKEKAKEAYMELINKFPDDPLSIQSGLLLDQLYMSDEELIENWKMKEQNQ
jgi:tetratricopeptide (TPR) repeat protein